MIKKKQDQVTKLWTAIALLELWTTEESSNNIQNIQKSLSGVDINDMKRAIPLEPLSLSRCSLSKKLAKRVCVCCLSRVTFEFFASGY